MCYQPITVKTPQGYRTVPCGHCLECLRKYQSDWSNRMYEELKAHDGKAVFFTLTYDDNNVPKNYLYYATATDYEIFRSPSDYGYNNTYTDEKGREKVLPSCGRERKHRRVNPYVELQEAGLDTTNIIDFNVKRKDGIKFREQIQDIYGNYLRNFKTNDCTTRYSVLERRFDEFHTYDFSSYEGPDFMDPEQGIMLDLFTDVLNDEAFEDNIENFTEKVKGDTDFNTMECVLDLVENNSTSIRQRPIMQFNSVRKKDVQDWIKRARRRREYAHKVKGEPLKDFTFFVTAEYGPRTLRPHYHGVIFGLDAVESIDMKTDWQKHHGVKIDWQNVDLSKGDMSYCAKYCSKGFFEHPLCSKDFFYMKPNAGPDERPFTEYHSKHYERCIEIFNIDAPIVDTPFKLVSKGLGVSWVEDHKDIVTEFQDIDFKDTDVPSTLKVVYAPHELVEAHREYYSPDFPLPFDDNYQDYIDKYGQDHYDKAIDLVYDLSMTSNLESEKEHVLHLNNKQVKEKDYGEAIERLFDRFHYFRTIKGQVISYGVPKYYRTKIFSDGLRSAFAAFIQQRNVEIYQEKLREMDSYFQCGENTEIILTMERAEQKEKYERMRNTYDKLSKIYNKSKI